MWEQSGPHPGHILCLTPGVKAVKSFHGVLPSLVMVYHKTNLCGKSFSISEDIVKKIVALTFNSNSKRIFPYDSLTQDDASPY